MSQSVESLIRTQFDVMEWESFKALNRNRMPDIDAILEAEFLQHGLPILLRAIAENVARMRTRANSRSSLFCVSLGEHPR